MSTEANKALVRRYVDEVWNRGNLAFLDEVVADDYELSDPASGTTVRGPAGLKALVTLIRGLFETSRLEIDELVAEGALVAWRWTMSGTLRRGGAAREVRTTGISIYEIRDARIVRRWGEADTLTLLIALGLVRLPAPVPARDRPVPAA